MVRGGLSAHRQAPREGVERFGERLSEDFRGPRELPRADALAKIADGDTFWHRMGDLGWLDEKGRLWFCGRKSHRVITATETLFTIPCEALFNNHPRVYRSALVGVGPRLQQRPVIIVELEKTKAHPNFKALEKELLAMVAVN